MDASCPAPAFAVQSFLGGLAASYAEPSEVFSVERLVVSCGRVGSGTFTQVASYLPQHGVGCDEGVICGQMRSVCGNYAGKRGKSPGVEAQAGCPRQRMRFGR